MSSQSGNMGDLLCKNVFFSKIQILKNKINSKILKQLLCLLISFKHEKYDTYARKREQVLLFGDLIRSNTYNHTYHHFHLFHMFLFLGLAIICLPGTKWLKDEISTWNCKLFGHIYDDNLWVPAFPLFIQ